MKELKCRIELTDIYPLNLAKAIFESVDDARKVYIPGISAALATLQDLLDNSIFTSRIDFALEVAIEALREKAEREGCVWCKEDNKVFHDGQHFHFFCSYCGKQLEVEHGE